jgi:hypothetical protein
MIKVIRTLFTVFTFLSYFLFSCSPSSKTDKPDAKSPDSSASPYPQLSNQEIVQLYSIAEKVDIIFYNLPMSVNQDDAASAKNTVLYISPAPAIMSHPCKPLGRLSWLSQGIIVREADIYADTGCQYLIFMKDNHPVAANALSESGIQFFNQVLNKVQQQQK